MGEKTKKKGSISYAKWGYIFIAPFFIIFAVFQLIPLGSTIYYSFFEYYRSGLKIIGPSFVGLENYITLLYHRSAQVLWQHRSCCGSSALCPQIAVSLLLAAWFTDLRLQVREARQFFKTVIYHAQPDHGFGLRHAVLRAVLRQRPGQRGADEPGDSLDAPIELPGDNVLGNRALIGLMNFLMWFGNTTIMLMAAIMGVGPRPCIEAAELDGCGSAEPDVLADHHCPSSGPSSCM